MEQDVLGLDIDGVILDFERVVRTYAEMYDLLWLRKSGKKNDEFNFFHQYDWNDDELAYFKEYILPFATKKTPLMACAKEALEILKAVGYRIVLITARGGMNPKMADLVKEVLDSLEIPYDDIYFKQFDKVEIAKKIGIKYMIDDSPTVVSKLADEGISSLYFRDKFASIIDHPLIEEVTNWGEILRILLKKDIDESIIKKYFPLPNK